MAEFFKNALSGLIAIEVRLESPKYPGVFPFGSLLRQLPNTTEVPDLLVDITQAGLGHGLEFTLFRPEREQPKDFYAELPISLTVSGSYHELAQFISDVAALPRKPRRRRDPQFAAAA